MARGSAADAGAALPPADPAADHTIRSVEDADRALSAAQLERATVETAYKAEQNECYHNFLAAKCLAVAKERRRLALVRLHLVENEAKAFKRRTRVEERDEGLLEQRIREVQDAPQREQNRIEREATRSDKALHAVVDQKSRADNEQRHLQLSADRAAQHELKEKRRRDEQAGDAKQRAANIAAHEKKMKEAEEHRLAVAAKKEKKESERIRKAGDPGPQP